MTVIMSDPAIITFLVVALFLIFVVKPSSAWHEEKRAWRDYQEHENTQVNRLEGN